MEAEMKLYVWNKDVFRDHKSGIAFALAESEEEARKRIYAVAGIDPDDEWADHDMDKPADVVKDVDQPCAFYMWGSQ